MKPNFFILGAPKCGTTTLAHWLSLNPDVLMASVKEPFFFSPDIVESDYKTLKSYERLFYSESGCEKLIGEASTTYLRSELAVRRIMEYQNNAKFIVMLRNPVKMAISLHSQELYALNEDIADFEAAWLAQKDRLGGSKIPKACRSPRLLQYKDACSVGTQLKRLLEIVPKERVFTIFLDDLKNDPLACLNSVERFLGAKESPFVDSRTKNARKTARFKFIAVVLKKIEVLKLKFGWSGGTGLLKSLHGFNKKSIIAPDLEPNFKRALFEEFYSEMKLIEGLTGRDLSDWRIL